MDLKGAEVGVVDEDVIQALLIEEGEDDVEFTEEFPHPLNRQGGGSQDEDPLGPLRLPEGAEDHARFDGFTEADFIG